MIITTNIFEEDSVAQHILHMLPPELNIFYCRGSDIPNLNTIENNTIIAIADHICANDFTYRYYYWSNQQHIPILDHLNKISENKSVTVITIDANTVKKYCKDVTSICWNPGVTGKYVHNAVHVSNKNFASTHVGISLNRQMRVHRIALISLLYGLNLDSNINVSALHLYKQMHKCKSTEFLDHNDWMFDERHDNLKKVLSCGFKKAIGVSQQVDDVYELDDNSETVINMSNIDNYNNRLVKLYQNSFIEIVSLTYFEEPSPVLCEKFINSVYGYNFPVIIGPINQVKMYEELGFDMFRDIVDHSYDVIDNPIDRLETAIKSNIHLFTEEIKNVWQKNKHRFEQNAALADNTLNNKIITDTFNRIKNTIKPTHYIK